MFKKCLWIVAIACSLAIGQAAFAGCACETGIDKMVASLKLDKAQKDKIKPILDQLKASVKDSAAQMTDLESQINQQATSASMDQATVDGLVDKKVKLIGDMMKAKITAKNQIFAILDDKQKAALQAMLKKSEDKMTAQFKHCHDHD